MKEYEKKSIQIFAKCPVYIMLNIKTFMAIVKI